MVRNFPKLNTFRLNWISFLLVSPLFIGIIARNVQNISHLSAAFWITLVVVVVGFYPIVTYLFFNSIRKKDLSDVLPLLGLVPIFTAVFGWLLLNQNVSFTALIGILFICLSIYFLNFKNKTAWYDPITKLVKSRASQSMLIVSLMTAVAVIGDKYAIEKSTASIYFAFNSIGAILVLFLCDFVVVKYNKKNFVKELKRISSKEYAALVLLGIVFAATQIISFYALYKASSTSYVVAVRNTNIVFASLLALVIYKEKVNRHKLTCYGLSAIGIVMIAI